MRGPHSDFLLLFLVFSHNAVRLCLSAKGKSLTLRDKAKQHSVTLTNSWFRQANGMHSVDIHSRELPDMMLAKYSDFFTPSPSRLHLDLIYTIK